MTEEMKKALFDKMLELNQKAHEKTFDGRDYLEQSEGAYKMLKVLGLAEEFTKWEVDLMA